jgi:K+-sensing histidine kinase KdpD
MAERIGQAAIPVTAEHRSGPVVRGVLVFAEEQEADLIVVGATSRGPVARRVLGTVTARLVERSRRPVLVITPTAERMSTSADRTSTGAVATKPVDALVAATEEAHKLKRSVGLLDLSALGLGAIIGTGIFVILGEAISDAAPAS